MAAYVIQPGDTPSGIARKFGMSFDRFKAVNPGLCDANNNCRILFPGQVLQVDAPGGAPDTPPANPTQPAAGFVPQAPPWMESALREQGVAEWNPGDNPRIVEYLASVGIRGGDETSWCAAFVNWNLLNSGFQGYRTGLAGQWINFGRAVAPTYGCIVVMQPSAPGPAAMWASCMRWTRAMSGFSAATAPTACASPPTPVANWRQGSASAGRCDHRPPAKNMRSSCSPCPSAQTSARFDTAAGMCCS